MKILKKVERKNKILSEIKKAVLSVDSNAEVILFGSNARGTAHEESDWDILILTNNKVDSGTEALFGKALLQVELAFPIAISTIIKNKIEWEDFENTDLYQNMKRMEFCYEIFE